MSIPALYIYKTLRVNKDLNALLKIKQDLIRTYQRNINHATHGPIVRNNTWVLVNDLHSSPSDSDEHWTVRLVDFSKYAQGTVHVYNANRKASFYPTGPLGKTYEFQTLAKPFPV